MNYAEFVKVVGKIACVLSITQKEDGTYGEVLNEAVNELYLKSINLKPEDYVPGKPYYEYVHKAVNFEEMVLKCIKEQKQVHAYINVEFYNAWMEVNLTPLVSDEKNKGYCLFSYEMNPKVDSDKMADIPPQVAWQVIKTSVKLRETRNFQEAVQTVADDIREFCKAHRSCLLLTDFDREKCVVLADSLSEDDDTPRMSTYVDDGFIKFAQIWNRMIGGSDCYIIHDAEEMEKLKEIEPIWYGAMKSAGAYNLVLFPLRYNGKTIGFFWVTNFDSENIMNIKATLQVTTFILASEVSNQLLLDELKRLSVTDLLTGLMNRNAISKRIQGVMSGQEKIQMPYGIVFVDLNGLKKVNDSKGHVSGDAFLTNAADTLKDIYKDQEIYRIGGDEFVVLTTGITREEFDEKVQLLKQQSNEYEQETFSIGTCFTEDDSDIAKEMRMADERMYLDKEAYYQRYPEKKRD